MSAEMVKYTAQDGQDITLTKEDVITYIVSGGGNPSTKDVVAFMAKCQARGLNPLAGDAYMVAYGNTSSVIVSKDYFVRTAQMQPEHDGFEAGVVIAYNGSISRQEGSLVLDGWQLVGGWARVYKKTQKYPVYAEVSLKEYNTGKSLWVSKPATMIRKVALVQALREAYPTAFGGIYDASEMPEPQEQASAPVQAYAEVPSADTSHLDPVRELFNPWRAALGISDLVQAQIELSRAVGASSVSSMTPEQAAKALEVMNQGIAQAQAPVVSEPDPIWSEQSTDEATYPSEIEF